ncbi:MAG: tetratricopeptide repeat protein [Holophagales bacterium]|jgi:tetratricopeptide (TPR) repeat protein|nr:tetratricopeptide repeat protein [Holophagales bacterium]
MSTKSKTSKPKSSAEHLEPKLNEAIKMVSANNVAEAIPLLETIAKEASAIDNFSIARVARSYIAHQQNKGVVPPDPVPIQEAVFLLNAKQPEAALEKIEQILKKESSNANVHYLKALALVETKQVELAAESLKTAIDLEPAIQHVYRLEPDFKQCRNVPCFANFELS